MLEVACSEDNGVAVSWTVRTDSRNSVVRRSVAGPRQRPQARYHPRKKQGQAGRIRMIAGVIHGKISQGVGRSVVKDGAEVIHRNPE